MATVEELIDLLARTKPPKQLLHPKFHAPPYMVDPVTKLAGSFHLPPYNAEEQAAIGEAKVAADKSGEQTRADLVFPNLLIGNMYAAQDAQYLASQVNHVLYKNPPKGWEGTFNPARARSAWARRACALRALGLL